MMKRTDKIKMNRNAASKNIGENYLNNRTSRNGNNDDMRSHHNGSGVTITGKIFVPSKSICGHTNPYAISSKPADRSCLEGNRMLAIIANATVTRHSLEFMITVSLAARQSTSLMNLFFF